MSAFDDAFLAYSPTLYLKTNEASGTFADSSGHGLTATKVGTVTYGQPSILPNDSDTSILLDGSTGRLTVADDPLLHFANSLTMCAWIKPTKVKATNVFAKGFDYGMDLPGVGVVRLSAAGGTLVSENWTAISGNTLFVVATHDKATGLEQLIVNGKLLKTRQVTAGTGIAAAGTNILEIGSFAGVQTFQGYMQKLGLVPTALTVADAQALYAAGALANAEVDGKLGYAAPYSRALLTLGAHEAAVLTNSSDTPITFSRGPTAVYGAGQVLQPRAKWLVLGSEYAGPISFIHPGYLGFKAVGIDRFVMS